MKIDDFGAMAETSNGWAMSSWAAYLRSLIKQVAGSSFNNLFALQEQINDELTNEKRFFNVNA